MNLPIVENLVIASHILADKGVLDGLGHISVRHPENPQRYLMSRSLAPALVKPADMMEYDLDSNAIDRQGRSLFLERFIHGETYKARPDVFAVIHSHSPTVIPFSISQTHYSRYSTAPHFCLHPLRYLTFATSRACPTC
jgi:ribulose-5-phosphate 4-epimerase/fuculose-1-phosphate aldolase